MTNKERIRNTVLCRSTDRAPFFFLFGPWPETITRWKKEGLQDGADWSEQFGFDQGITEVDFNYGFCPWFENKEIENNGKRAVVCDEFGITKEINLEESSIPRYLKFPVENREDWEKLKERLNPNSPERFPDNWSELTKKYNNPEAFIQLGVYPYGLFGTIRELMGVENLLMGFYDQPELIRDMMDDLTDFWLSVYSVILKDVKADSIHIWEDMSGKTGSLISPALIRKFMLPNYQKIKQFACNNNIDVISLDTDGDCSQLIPVFMEGGINLMLPFEVMPQNDILEYRKKYPNLGMLGGIDKILISQGKAAIDKELARISKMLEYPGYIPNLDHLVHPEISWDDFQYFVYQLKKLIGA